MSTSNKRLYSFKVAAAATRGMAVKGSGTVGDTVAKCAAATDKAIGILQNTTTDVNEVAEVALPGGGAMGLLGGSVDFGDMLGFGTDAKLVKVATAGDRVIAMAMASGVAGDLIPVEVLAHKAESSQA